MLVLLRPHNTAHFLQNILRQKLLKKSTAYQEIRLDFFNNFWCKRCSRNVRYYVVGVILFIQADGCAICQICGMT
jgi:hypothetical protein